MDDFGFGFSACQSESVAPLPSASLPSASISSNPVESTIPGTFPSPAPSVFPCPTSTPGLTPEVGPRAVYYLKKESSERFEIFEEAPFDNQQWIDY